MASSIFSLTMLLLVLVMIQSSMATLDFNLAPTFSPLFDNNSKLCEEVNCGRGNCSIDVTKPFSFVCKCDPGWRRTRPDRDDDDDDHDEDDDDLQFLPCVIPNCSLDYTCMPAPPPTPPVPKNISAFDPCYWTYCGEGTCNMNHTYKHTCDCNPGYTNLMNISHFPCFSSCAIGSDCSRLGVRLLDANATSPSGDSNQGNKFLHGGFYWIGITVMTVTMALWK